MNRILIVEDEFIIAQNLRQVLEGLGYEVAGHAFDAGEALGILAGGGVDLAVLDINLGSGPSGITLGRQVMEMYGIPILFLTSHTDAGTIREAAELRPAGYLVKPFNPAEVHACVEIALAGRGQRPRVMTVKVGASHRRVDLDDVQYLKADRVYVEVHLMSGPSFLSRESLTVWEERLPGDFLRVSRSIIVRLGAVDAVHAHGVTVGGTELTMTRITKDEMVDMMLRKGK